MAELTMLNFQRSAFLLAKNRYRVSIYQFYVSKS